MPTDTPRPNARPDDEPKAEPYGRGRGRLEAMYSQMLEFIARESGGIVGLGRFHVALKRSIYKLEPHNARTQPTPIDLDAVRAAVSRAPTQDARCTALERLAAAVDVGRRAIATYAADIRDPALRAFAIAHLELGTRLIDEVHAVKHERFHDL